MRVVTSDTAVGLVRGGDTILTGGSGLGRAVPHHLIAGTCGEAVTFIGSARCS